MVACKKAFVKNNIYDFSQPKIFDVLHMEYLALGVIFSALFRACPQCNAARGLRKPVRGGAAARWPCGSDESTVSKHKKDGMQIPS